MKHIRCTLLVMCLMGLCCTSVSAAVPMGALQQIDLLARNAAGDSGWFIGPEHEDWSEWYYAAADLDRDGSPEIWRAKGRHDGKPPDIGYTEIREGGILVSGAVRMKGNVLVPDIFSDVSAAYPEVMQDPEMGKYHYFFLEKRPKDGDTVRYVQYALTAGKDPVLEVLASETVQDSGIVGITMARFWIPSAETEWTEITADRYEDIREEYFPGCRSSRVQLKWMAAAHLAGCLEQGRIAEYLIDSYDVFLNGSWMELTVTGE